MTPLLEDQVSARILAAPCTPRKVQVILRYTRDDPFALALRFPAEVTFEERDISWVFSRELLEAGLRGPAGEGDVQLWPSGGDRTVVELHALEGMAMIEFATSALRRFLWRTYQLTPQGEENLNLQLDKELAELLGGVQ